MKNKKFREFFEMSYSWVYAAMDLLKGEVGAPAQDFNFFEKCTISLRTVYRREGVRRAQHALRPRTTQMESRDYSSKITACCCITTIALRSTYDSAEVP